METWGIGCFDNDVATRWALQLIGCNDLSVITSTLNLTNTIEPLTAVDACKVLAAIETIAKLLGEAGNKTTYSESVDEWVKNNQIRIDQATINIALDAIETITEPESILLEQWEKKEDFVNWMKELELLRSRLLK